MQPSSAQKSDEKPESRRPVTGRLPFNANGKPPSNSCPGTQQNLERNRTITGYEFVRLEYLPCAYQAKPGSTHDDESKRLLHLSPKDS